MIRRRGKWAARLAAGAVIANAFAACASDARCPPTTECPVCPSAMVASATSAPSGVSSGVSIDLRKAEIPTEVQAILVVTITASGDIFVGDQNAENADAVRSLARVQAEKQPDLRAVMRADRKVSHGTVIEVVDALKQAGVTRVAFEVAPPAPAVAPSP